MLKTFPRALAVLLILSIGADTSLTTLSQKSLAAQPPTKETISKFTKEALAAPFLSERLPSKDLEQSLRTYVLRMGQRLAALRKREAMKASDFAEAISVTQPAILSLEQGKASGHLSFWFRVAKFSNMPLEILLNPYQDLPSKTQEATTLPTYSVIYQTICNLMIIQGHTHHSLANVLGMSQANITYVLRRLSIFEGTSSRGDVILATLFKLSYGLQVSGPHLFMLDNRFIHEEALRLRDPDRDKPTSDLNDSAKQYLFQLGLTVKQLRRRMSNLSQMGLAAEVDVSQPMISTLEAGRHWPTLAMILALANYFQIPPEKILNPELTVETKGSLLPADIQQIGPMIAASVKESGLPQATLARFIGIEQPSVAATMTRLTQGQNISLYTVFALAWATKKSISELLQSKPIRTPLIGRPA